jgi:hypothetical protein
MWVKTGKAQCEQMFSGLPQQRTSTKLSLAARISEVAIRTADLFQGITIPRRHDLGARGVALPDLKRRIVLIAVFEI